MAQEKRISFMNDYVKDNIHKIIYAIATEDIQIVANEELERDLTNEEIELIIE